MPTPQLDMAQHLVPVLALILRVSFRTMLGPCFLGLGPFGHLQEQGYAALTLILCLKIKAHEHLPERLDVEKHNMSARVIKST